jgi:hypothetical protein
VSATLIPEDLGHVLARLPRDVVSLLQKHPQLMLGGGFIRSIIAGERINDVDLFGPSHAMLESIAKGFALERKARFHATDNAFTVLTSGRHPVQFIHRWVYDEPQKLLSEFDFTIAQCVIWWAPALDNRGEWHSLISEHFYPDLASKRLRYLSPDRAEDAGGSLLRARKFLARGYHIEAHSLAKVVARLVRGVRDTGRFDDEQWLGSVLTGLLREVDPLTIIDGLDLVDESQPPNAVVAPAPPPAPAVEDDVQF